ncbi:MAG: D-alanine--D-alanine ligase [Sphingomonadales bacterium]|nr:D-alanine--D-alanine ligase [Sphingomonadales bacterium]
MGGNSREREVSFAGGRTVMDNLDKSLFEAIPIFIDSFGEPVWIDWKWLYKGSIRDFYPDTRYYPDNAQGGTHTFYAEQLGPHDPQKAAEWRSQLGKPIRWDEIRELVDLAFLALHGKNGEDGRIQGLLEYHGIPYTGSGIGASAIGMNKLAQRRMMKQMGLPVPEFRSIDRQSWFCCGDDVRQRIFKEWSDALGFPMVIKPANQGSSIGMTILSSSDSDAFMTAIDRALFRCVVQSEDWLTLPELQRIQLAEEWSDPKSGIGLPARGSDGLILYNAPELVDWLSKNFEKSSDCIYFDSLDSEMVVLGESFLSGDEFSCIVIESDTGEPIALPPTGIRKSSLIYDYRAKYLPGQARKTTPIDLPDAKIRQIQQSCEELYTLLGFQIYARIDGFINSDGIVYLNDPNTTSGMMPSSFFFHQAAEVGMNPSQFLTYIAITSLRRFAEPWEIQTMSPEKSDNHLSTIGKTEPAFIRMQRLLHSAQSRVGARKPIAVIMGGSSSERHISVESGRNVYEKLSSSGDFEPISLFLTGNDAHFRLYEIPINLHLKDHADDIAGKLNQYSEHTVVLETRARCTKITELLGCRRVVAPREITIAELAEMVGQVFIALHGRPGEDGTLQKALEAVGLTYNGSGPESSGLTIDKFRTNRMLDAHGLQVADARLIDSNDVQTEGGYEALAASIIRSIPLPLIAKPIDDGCSSGVVRIDSQNELTSYLSTHLATPFSQSFSAGGKLAATDLQDTDRRETNLQDVNSMSKPELNSGSVQTRDRILIEECIVQGDADRLLEVTGGMLIHTGDKGERTYEVFEPSESLAGKGILSLEEKFLAGEGQNITPARFSTDPQERDRISVQVKAVLEETARILGVRGYCRIDAFVRIYERTVDPKVEVLIIEVNSLPGMTPATCIFHQCALQGYKPDEFIRQILAEGRKGRAKTTCA